MASDKFSRPPSGVEISGDGIKKLVEGKSMSAPAAAAPTIEDVAQVLGGKVIGDATKPQKDIEVEVMDPVVDGEVIDKEDQREYLRTLLAGERFSKTYELYDKTLLVTFKTRTTSENDSVALDMQEPKYKELIEAKSYAIIRERLRITISCEALIVGAKTVPDVSLSYFESMNEIAFAAVRRSFRNFESICDVMFQRANDSNFWKGIAGTI